nr:MAG TPA: hypothetical protein [Caudoviricetes sp.]
MPFPATTNVGYTPHICGFTEFAILYFYKMETNVNLPEIYEARLSFSVFPSTRHCPLGTQTTSKSGWKRDW